LPVRDNEASVRSFYERVLNAGDLSSLEAFAHSDVVVPQVGRGLESFRGLLSDTRKTLSNPQYKILDMISRGEEGRGQVLGEGG
jgi:predicted ester cyclase